jgi:hypothetical protein
VLTTLMSVNPIYASFNADEQVVTHALKTLADESTPSEIGLPARPVDATQVLNLSAGVSNCKVSRGRSLS